MSKLYFPLCKRILFRLSTNKDADFETRIITRREVNRLRSIGVPVYILGTVNQIIVKKTPVPVKVKQHILLSGPKPQVPSKGGFSCSIKDINGSNGDKGDTHGLSQSVGMNVSTGGGNGIRYTCNPDMEQLLIALVKRGRKEITKERRSINMQELSLKQKKDALAEKEKEQKQFEEKLSTITKAKNGQANDNELKNLKNQSSLPVDEKKLLAAKYEESLLMTTMLDATESFLGPNHLLIEGSAKWSDYHVLICLLFYLHINHFGNPSLLYGLRSKFFNYFKKEPTFKTLHSYRQFAQVTAKLLDGDIDFEKKITKTISKDTELTIGRISLYKWWKFYWDLSEIFEKHIF